jgi:hypothetical protein
VYQQPCSEAGRCVRCGSRASTRSGTEFEFGIARAVGRARALVEKSFGPESIVDNGLAAPSELGLEPPRRHAPARACRGLDTGIGPKIKARETGSVACAFVRGSVSCIYPSYSEDSYFFLVYSS